MNNNPNIKSKVTGSIGYTGVVTLSQYTGGKEFIIAKTLNKGGLPLFNFFADCLMGDFGLAANALPYKIALLNSNGSTLALATNTKFITLLALPEKVYSDKEGIVKYRFILPQEYFAAGRTSNAVKFNAIGLYAKHTEDVNDYLAFCEVNTASWNMSLSSVLVLDWELHITN